MTSATPSASEARIRGERLILWLFVVLAVATAASLWLFAHTEMGRPYATTIGRALAGDLAIPVVAWFVLKGIAATGKPRWGWWGLSILAGAATYLLVTTLLGIR